MSDPIDKIIAAVTAEITDDILLVRDFCHKSSPIEAIMASALHALNYTRGVHSFIRIEIVGPEAISSKDDWVTHFGMCCWIVKECPIGNYRADFVVHAPLPGHQFARLVVECDGHDFHERTKEQAEHDRSRDRFMQEQGYTVFRFTGREIYRDPMKCANQVIAWAEKATFL